MSEAFILSRRPSALLHPPRPATVDGRRCSVILFLWSLIRSRIEKVFVAQRST
jgi:hypothetical protein